MTGHASPVQEGDLLAGRYRVERVLGAGGMGVVVAAVHVALGHRVAAKFLLPAAFVSPQAVARFLREAQASVELQSEHVARVLDFGTLENGAPFMVMELLEGCDLAQLLVRSGPLPVTMAVDYLLQACEAVAEAHALGMVHRDLKPANLFLTRRRDGSPLVKVLDFGISKVGVGSPDDAGLTSTAAALGSPFYMSPEQLRSTKYVDQRADIWSIGVVLHELLSGRHVFEGETLTALALKIAGEPPPPLRLHRPDAPPEIERAILACLEKDVARRIPSLSPLAAVLAPFGTASAVQSAERIARLSSRSPHLAASQTAPLPAASGAEVQAASVAAPASSAPRAPAHSPPAAAPAVTASSFGSTAGTKGRRASQGVWLVAGALAVGLAGAGVTALVLRLDRAPTLMPSAAVAPPGSVTSASTPAPTIAERPTAASMESTAPPPRALFDAGAGSLRPSRPGAPPPILPAAPPVVVAPIPHGEKVDGLSDRK